MTDKLLERYGVLYTLREQGLETDEQYDELMRIESQINEKLEKAEALTLMIPFLRINLSKKQLDELSVITDPLARKILAYLVSEK